MTSTVAAVCEGLLALSLILAFARVWWGPSLPDRLIALDLVATVSVGLIVLVLAGMGAAAIRTGIDTTAPNIYATTIGYSLAVILSALAVGGTAMLLGARHLKRLEV